MNKTTEALKLAEEALVYHTQQTRPIQKTDQALAAIREALAEPVKQEPVAVISQSAIGLVKLHSNGACLPFGTQLYAAPVSAKREWVELTDDEILKAIRGIDGGFEGFRALIAAFKEKNNANNNS